MVSIKSVVRALVFVISGIAIVVVGGFMMGAVARLWLPKGKKEKKRSEDSKNSEKTD